jgi:hemerythrin
MSIAWDPSLTVGHVEIDDQHRELFRRAAALMAALDGGRATEEVAGTLGFLTAYVREHFGAEEGLMLLHRYPARAAHQAQHRAFMAEVGRYLEEFAAQGPNPELRNRLERFLVGWLQEHICGTDRALGAFLCGGAGAAPAA